MYACGWTPHPALILSPIEHFEIASSNYFFYISAHLKLRRPLESLFSINTLGYRRFIGRNPMNDKIISIESAEGPHQLVLKRIWRMVPDRDKDDLDLKRLLAFRVRVDGEAVTSEYLMRKIRDMIQCAYKGRLFDFLKDDRAAGGCRPPATFTDPPEIA
jgi:hypothetical protein